MRLIITFIISLISFFTLNYFQIGNIFIIALVVLSILLVVLYPMLHTILFETNISKIERFLLKNKKNPNLYMIYALANELDEEVRGLTEKLLQKYKNRSRQAMYTVGKALYFKDIEEAKLHINQISQLSYRLYYQSIILIEEGDFDGAVKMIEEVSTKWMKDALLAELEKKRNNLPNAKKYANQAKLHSKGLQRYLLHKTYEREFGI